MYDNLAQTQKPRNLITLEEFFPKKFFQNDSAEAVHTVSRYEIHDEKEDVNRGGPNENLSFLKELQSQVNKIEPLQSSTSPKEVLTQALEKPEMCTPSTNTLQQAQDCYACSPDLTFIDKDLLLTIVHFMSLVMFVHKRSIVFSLMEVQLLIYYQK